MSDTTTLSVTTVPVELLDAARAQAEREGVSLAEVVRRGLSLVTGTPYVTPRPTGRPLGSPNRRKAPAASEAA